MMITSLNVECMCVWENQSESEKRNIEVVANAKVYICQTGSKIQWMSSQLKIERNSCTNSILMCGQNVFAPNVYVCVCVCVLLLV